MLRNINGTNINEYGVYAGTVLSVIDAALDNAFVVYGGLYNGASSEFRTNGVSRVTGNAGANAIASIRLGARYSNTFNLAGDMAEFAVANAAWSDAQRQAAELTANDYWAVYDTGGSTGSEVGSVTQDTSTFYAGAASAKVVAQTNFAFTQSVNVGDTNTYNLSAYAYTDESAVTSADVELYYNGSTVSTTYTSVGSGWYQLTGTVTGADESRDYGVQVKADKTVYLDDMSLNSYASSGTLTSSIFDSEFSVGASWGTLSYTSSGSTVSVKARTSNSSTMSGATAFSSCNAITSGTDISSNNCVTDGHRYIQYQAALSTSSTALTPTFSDVSIAFAVYDPDAPSISLTALSPDPNNDNTPSLTGTATDVTGTISAVQSQMDATSGSWSSCTADDGSFDEASETFTCTVSTALADGSHTMYVRATDSNGNTTASGSESSDAFTIDATAPISIDLDSPGNNSYSNSERPSFKWKATTDATAGLSKYVLEIDNPSLGSGQPTGDFAIDDIPTSRTTDYETNRYVIHYENFSDSDATNNYISVYTKSSNEWSTDSTSGQNDGKLREGKVNWKVKARDNAGNETSSSRTLFVDRTNPKVEFTQVNDSPFSSTSFSTTDKTPTIYGKITDPLSGGDSGQSQNDDGPKVASGPKLVDIKVEKKEGLTYKLHTLYTINMDKPWYTCDTKEVTDNSKQKCDKYLPFEYTVKDNLDLGSYKITITGKDKADNSSSSTSFTLNIGSLSQVVTPQEEEIVEKVIEEEFPEATREEKEQIKEELEITKPKEPTALEKTGTAVANTGKNVLKTTGNFISQVGTGIGNGVKTVASTIWSGVTFTTGKIGEAIAYDFNMKKNNIIATWYLISNISSYIAQTIGNTYNSLAQSAPGVIGDGMEAVGNGAKATGDTIGTVAQNIGTGITNMGTAIAQGVGNATKATKEGITNIAFAVGEKTQDVSDTVGLAIIKFTYNFVNEPTRIAEVNAEILSSTSVKITWTTNHPANGKVNYGFKSGEYTFEEQTDKRTSDHEFILTDLKPGTEYHFEVMSQNKNYVYDANRTFKTPSVTEK